jgi:hypothetical protein
MMVHVLATNTRLNRYKVLSQFISSGYLDLNNSLKLFIKYLEYLAHRKSRGTHNFLAFLREFSVNFRLIAEPTWLSDYRAGQSVPKSRGHLQNFRPNTNGSVDWYQAQGNFFDRGFQDESSARRRKLSDSPP